MTDYMRQVRTGEQMRIKARTFNEFLLAAARARGTLFRAGAGVVTNPNDPGMVLLYNESGADVDFGHVLGIDSVQGMVLASGHTGDAADDRVINLERRIVCGVTPTADHVGRWALVLEGTPTEEGGTPSAILPDGTAGVGILSGVWPAIINVVDQNHRCAEVDPDAVDPTMLSSAASGSAQIVWKESTGTGERWAGIRFPFSRDRYIHIADAADFGTLNNQAASTPDGGTLDPYWNKPPGTDHERRVVVKANRSLGVPCPIGRLGVQINADEEDSQVEIKLSGSFDEEFGWASGPDVSIEVRAIIVDFDPDTLTWNEAYVTDGGLLADGGMHATELVIPLYHHHCRFPELGGYDAWGYIYPGLPAVSVPSAWNEIELIYGFELRYAVSSADVTDLVVSESLVQGAWALDDAWVFTPE